MKAQRLTAVAVLAFAFWLCGSGAPGSPLPQNKRSKSDADVNAIGHRRIVHDANLYSPEREKELGRALSQEVERSSKLLTDPIVTEYIGLIAQNVANNSDARIPITVRVIDSDVVNAFTLPGGYQYINRGLLLKLQGEAELASLLARGIAHTALRSATREATKVDLMQVATGVLVLPGSASSIPLGSSSAIPLTELKFRRQDELDADYFAVQYVYKAGYDPKCFTDFVQRIWSTSSGTANNVQKVFSAFPPLDERLAALQDEITKILPPREGAIVSTAEFDVFKERLPAQKSGPELKRPTEDMEPRDPKASVKPS
jgi:beta-barrel assembly-enhancing protease